MRAVDALAGEVEQPTFLESHYHQFGLSSQQLHVHLDGPAVFREDPARVEMVVFIEPRILLGFVSLRYAAYYFSLATQAIAILLGLDDLRDRVVLRYHAFVVEADEEVQRLVEAGQP
jgi:hypothetical protein